MKLNQHKTVSNRTFGFFFTAVFGLIAAYFYYTATSPAEMIFVALSLITLAITILYPSLLLPFNRAWMNLGVLLGKIISPVIMAVIFFVLITPIAVITRIFGRDELDMKTTNNYSYWKNRQSGKLEPSSFKNQF